MKSMRIVAVLVAGALVSCDSREADGPPRVESGIVGSVVDEEGSPVSGAFVTVVPEGADLSLTVVSDAQGRYALPLTRSGSYRLTAKPSAGASAGAESVVQFAGIGTVEQDVTVGEPDAVWDRAPARAILSRLPAGEDKRRFILDCTGCHQFDQLVVGVAAEERLKNRDEWLAWATQMINGNLFMSPSRTADATVDWLTRHLGPTPASTARPELAWPATPVTPESARAVVTEYPLLVPQDLPHDVKVDVDGKVLVTGQLTGVMYLLDPETGETTFERLPIEQANPRAIDIDSEGNWFVALGAPESIARKDRASGEWDIRFVDVHPHSIQLDAMGAIWYNGHFSKSPELIGRLHFEDEEPQPIIVPDEPMPDGGITMQYGLRVAPDGTVWTTQLMGGKLIRHDPPTGEFELYPLPTPRSGPRRPDIGADGRVWIPEYANNKLAVFDPTSERFTEWELPLPDMLPYVVRVDRARDRVWIGTSAGDAIVRFDPSTETYEVFPLPMKGVVVRHLDVDERTGDVWGSYGAFPSRDRNRVFRLQTR